MRIGLLTDMYKPFMSGVTNFVAQHKQALEALGHEVFVFTLGHVDYEDDEPRVYRSPAIPVTETGYQFGLLYSRLARRKVRTMDVLHAQHPFVSGALAVTYGRRDNIPVVFTNHSRYDQVIAHYVPGPAEGVSTVLLDAYLPWFANQCQAVTAPTPAVRRVLREFGVSVRIPVIPNGVDLAPFRAPRALRTRAELGLLEKDRVSIYVGRVAPEKNLPYLLRAFSLVHQSLPDAYLMVVGYGQLDQDLRQQAAELGIAGRTVFTGRVPYQEVPAHLTLADLFVTASVIEVQPLSIIEGLAAGLPAVAIASDAVNDILTDGHNGLLSSADIQDFAAAWVRLLSDDALRARLAANAQESSRKYDIHRTAAQVAELYREVIAECRRQPEQPEKAGLPL